MGISESPPESPLRELSLKLICWPPSISRLISVIGSCEAFSRFIEIIDEFLPEHRALILSYSTMEDQVAHFAAEFKEKYFPLYQSLEDGMVEEYEQITVGIPVEVHGLPYDAYHELDWFRPGILLMTSLLDSDTEGRIPLLEECKKHVPVGLLNEAPKLSIQQAEDLLEDTAYKGLIHWSRIWEHSTGFYFLDVNYEDGWEQIEWDAENVAALKRDWDGSLIYENVAYELGVWIEEDIETHFKEMIDFIKEAQDAKRTNPVPVGRARRIRGAGGSAGDPSGLSS